MDKVKKIKELKNTISDNLDTLMISINELESEVPKALDKLPEILRNYREKKEISQSYLATICGTNVKTIQKIEDGDLNLNLKSLIEVTKAIGVEICLK